MTEAYNIPAVLFKKKRYDPTWVDTDRAKAALAQVTEAAGTVMEYMTLLEAAPPLKAEGLADGYRVLAEFNGTVLTGTETLLGAQFVTWARDYDRRGVNNGHYYMEDYKDAELADMLGCKKNSIRMKLTRARRRAFQLMTEEEGDRV